jgi:uncharacterized membrane-anchored protein
LRTHLIVALLFITFLGPDAEAKSYREFFGVDAPPDKYGAVLRTLNFQQGPVRLGSASVTLTVPDQFYYLSPTDTRKVLVDLWSNPASEADGVLGMIFPAKYSPTDAETWGSVIDYDPSGYVSDADAATTNFDEVLQQIKDAIAEANPEREKAGFGPVTLVGWAAPPFYDKEAHALHWARELIFGKDRNADHQLNYSVRVLGREGVVDFDFVAGLDQLAEINAVIPAVIKTVQYDSTKGYSDHIDGDKVAAYGLAGMIAAAAGVKIAAKLGLIALGLGLLKNFGLAILALKKGIVLLIVPIVALGRWIKAMFSRKNNSDV